MTPYVVTMSQLVNMVTNYIMAGCAFVVAKEVFIMQTVVFLHCGKV